MYGKGLAKNFRESTKWNYTDLKQYPMVGYSSDFSPGLITELIRRQYSYDIILSSGLATFATHISFPIAKLLKKKFIIWSEDWMWSKSVIARMVLPYVRTMVQRADACIAAGKNAKELFLHMGAKPERVFVAPNCALDVAKMHMDNKKLEDFQNTVNPTKKIVISYLGRVVSYKALDTLIDAFSELEKKARNVLLLIVGDGPFAPACARLIQKKNITNFYWPQYNHLTAAQEYESIPHDELMYYAWLSDILVLPGRFKMQDHVTCESWGLILNEAISLGKPIISTNSVAAAYDLIENDKNGYRIPEDSSEALADGLEKLVKNPAGRKAMGIRSREIFETRFQYPNMMQGFQNAINAVSI